MVGEVVRLADDLAGVQAPDGGLLPPDRLGFGVVQAQAPDGTLQVHWLDPDFTSVLAPDEVRRPAPGRRLVSIVRCDDQGRHKLLHRHLAALAHHWTVELLPRRVVRVVQETGLCWTFRQNPLTHEADPPWPEAPDDNAAEAVAAADFALRYAR